MQNIGYIRWAYIPVDSDPKNNEITTWNPHVLTNIALDDGASLVIDLSYSLAYINIFIQTTAFSKPVDPDLSLNIFLTDVNNTFVIVDQKPWEIIREGNFVIHKLKLKSNLPLSLIKVSNTGPTIIINSIYFKSIDS